MSRLTSLLADDDPGRARVGTLIFSVPTLLLAIPEIQPGLPAAGVRSPWSRWSLLLADLGYTVRRGRLPLLEPLWVAPLVVAYGTSLVDPLQSVGLCLG